MPNTKKFSVKSGLQTQNIDFVSSNETNTLNVSMLDSDVLSVSGNSGQLFSISDSMSGFIFAVNDISGVPSIEVTDLGIITLAETFGKVLIGTAVDNGVDKVQVTGNITATGVIKSTNSFDCFVNSLNPHYIARASGATSADFNYILRGDNDGGTRAVHFVNSTTRTSDGGTNTYTIRNDGGNLRLGTSAQTTVLEGSTVTTASQIISTKANNTANGGGQIYLNGATGNRIDFNGSGVAVPSFTTRSLGTKIVLWPGVAATTVDYAFGIEAYTLWQSVPESLNTHFFKWYAGTTNIATLNGVGDLTIAGNLTVNGTTTTVNSTTVTIDDPIFTLGGDTTPTVDDNKDRGIEFKYHNGTAAKVGYFGFDDSTSKFTFIPDATNTAEVFSGTKGTIDANIEWADILSKPDPVITLSGDVSGSGTMTDLGSVTITATVADNSHSHSNYVADTGDTMTGALDVSFGGNSIVIGADAVLSSRTNATEKHCRVGGYHYTNAEEPVAMICNFNLATENNVAIGGGSSLLNTANVIRFFTATNTTTLSGTERFRLDSNGNILVGITTARDDFFSQPNVYVPRLQIEGTSTGDRMASIIANSNDAGGPHLILGKTRSATVGGTTVVQNGDTVGNLTFQSSDGTNLVYCASISAAVDGVPGTNDMPGRLVFSTTADGAGSLTERMRINSSGQVSINTDTAASYLSVLFANGALGDNVASRGIVSEYYGVGAYSGKGGISKVASGTKAAPTAVSVGHLSDLSIPLFYDGSIWRVGSQIYSQVTAITANTSISNCLIFKTGTVTGDATTGAFTGSTESMRINSAGQVGINTSAPETWTGHKLVVGTSSVVADNTAAGVSTFDTGTTGAINTGGAFAFGGHDGLVNRVWGRIYGAKENGTSGNYAGYIAISTRTNGAAPAERMRIDSVGNVGIGVTNPTNKLEVNGSFAATSKSFLINHPTKDGMKLRYGSLESPYHGVRLTGTAKISGKTCIIKLPDYICGLCKQEGSQVQLTGIKHSKVLWVDDINVEDNSFSVGIERGFFDRKEYEFFWSFTGIRKDIDDLIVEN